MKTTHIMACFKGDEISKLYRMGIYYILKIQMNGFLYSSGRIQVQNNRRKSSDSAPMDYLKPLQTYPVILLLCQCDKARMKCPVMSKNVSDNVVRICC